MNRRILLLPVFCVVHVVAARGQGGIQFTPMAHAIGVISQVDPIPGTGSLTESRLVQPTIMGIASALNGRVSFTATLNFEGATMPDGELAPGVWGEGYVDRRHPHTTFHELILATNDLLGSLDGRGRLGVVLGKGFVPFGTDDPMNRPFERYPVNHHLSQLLERAVGIVQYDFGPVTIEGALFNGDEPTKPSDWPVIRLPDGTWRFGDSRAGRLTVRPVRGLEVQGSLAKVHSAEHREGVGPDACKSSASVRWDDKPKWGERYAMVEYARTSELDQTFVFHTVLGEGTVRRGRWSAGYRFERTERPEETRLFDLFRTMRPSTDNSIIGISRFTLHTLHVAGEVFPTTGRLRVTPFLEGTFGHVAPVVAGGFDPAALYGSDRVRQLSAGVTLDWVMRDHRMGRYGVLAGGTGAGHDMGGMKM